MEVYKELLTVLEATTSTNATARKNAVGFLENAALNNYTSLVEGLVTIFADDGTEPVMRSTAGLYLKNMLTSRVGTVRTALVNKWLGLEKSFRNVVKNKILFVLGRELTRPSIAAQLICVIAQAELPVGDWPDLLNILQNNIFGAVNSLNSLSNQHAQNNTNSFNNQHAQNTINSSNNSILAGISLDNNLAGNTLNNNLVGNGSISGNNFINSNLVGNSLNSQNNSIFAGNNLNKNNQNLAAGGISSTNTQSVQNTAGSFVDSQNNLNNVNNSSNSNFNEKGSLEISGEFAQKIIEASIEAIGYMCQDLPQSVLAPYSSDILNNIVFCMNKERNERIRLVATKAMLNSIEFVSKNFAVEMQRNLIMQSICEASIDAISGIKVVGLQCLSRVISLYYDYMESYMTQALFSITYEAMKSEIDEVCLQGIEFWSTLCEIEEEIVESFENNEIPQSVSKNYCQKAISHIAPYILERLCKDDEEDDDDDNWNPHKAASVCLMLMTRNCVTEISSLILSFIGANFNHAENVRRDAALVALGSLIEASNNDQVDVIIQNGYPIIIQLCKDPTARVRDTAFWALGKIYHRQNQFASDTEKTLQSMKTIFDALSDSARVVVNALWAMTYIIKAMHDPLRRALGRQPDTLIISNNYENILNAAYMTIKRQDASERSLRIAAFELLNTLVECHPMDVHHLIGRNMDFVLQQCNQLFYATGSELSQSQSNELAQLQSLYCMLLQNFIHALDPREINHVSEPLLVTLMNYCTSCKKSTVQEDILLTIGVLVQKSPSDKILPQLQTLIPIILVLFQNMEDISLCVSCSSVIGDICTSAGSSIASFAPGIITIIFRYLSQIETDIQLQIHLLVLLGDLAIAMSSNFKPFVSECLDILKQVSSVSSNPDDDFYVIEYIDELKSTSLEAYTSIIQGVYRRLDKNEEDYMIWMKNIPYIMTLIESISNDPNHSDEVTRSCCGLIGDLFHLFHRELLSNIKNDSIQKLVIEAINSQVSKTQTVGFWLKSLLESN